MSKWLLRSPNYIFLASTLQLYIHLMGSRSEPFLFAGWTIPSLPAFPYRRDGLLPQSSSWPFSGHCSIALGLPCAREPTTALQAWPHLWRVEGKDNLPWPAPSLCPSFFPLIWSRFFSLSFCLSKSFLKTFVELVCCQIITLFFEVLWILHKLWEFHMQRVIRSQITNFSWC